MTVETRDPVTFDGRLSPQDVLGRYWLRQAVLRLRRELVWRWRGAGDSQKELGHALEQARLQQAKTEFFTSDETASFLTLRLEAAPPEDRSPRRGSFSWAVEALRLDDSARLALALALLPAIDSTAGSVIAACAGDSPRVTLALMQQLLDRPEDALALADIAHPLFASGLVLRSSGAARDWDAPLFVPSLVAKVLLFSEGAVPHGLDELDPPSAGPEPVGLEACVEALKEPARRLRVVRVIGPTDAPCDDAVAKYSKLARRRVFALSPSFLGESEPEALAGAATWSWLTDSDLFADLRDLPERQTLRLPPLSIRATLFLAAKEQADLKMVSGQVVSADLATPPSTHEDRLAAWRRELGEKLSAQLEPWLPEVARRYRFQEGTIRRVALRLIRKNVSDEGGFFAACRSELRFAMGDLAEEVKPRFQARELVLPPGEQQLFEEILRAMRALTEVHYGWGLARPWSEAGISVLFAGPPGTGKTMAAECLASELDLPMFRVDLSQVVSKYVGETEKNLKKVFDVAEQGDALLFFDEAESLFGKRAEIKSAQDRWANLEVSYLLSRMERSKGLTILATNRKEDFDVAFLRRLRYVVDFPRPEEKERLRIWRTVLPENVDTSELSLEFLARQFTLTGGQIRSAVLNACLQSARGEAKPKLTMEPVVIAVKRELDKLSRSGSLDQFGAFAGAIERLERRT